jgi:chromosome segregation ATPase
MISAEVRQLSGGFLTQLRGIFSGLEKLPLAFGELEQRERAVEQKERSLEDRQRGLQDSIDALSTQETALQQAVQRVKKELGGFQADLADKVRVREDRLAELDEQIAAKEQQVADLNAALVKVAETAGSALRSAQS